MDALILTSLLVSMGISTNQHFLFVCRASKIGNDITIEYRILNGDRCAIVYG